MSDKTEDIILCVESHPCLWDTSNNDYKDKEKKSLAWLEICSTLIQNWETFDEDARRLKSLELKKKWTNCRDCYKNKYDKKRRSRYIYAPILGFLDKVGKKNHEENDDTGEYLELEVLENIEDDVDEQREPQKAVEGIKNEYKPKNTNKEPAPKKRKLQHVPDEISNISTLKTYTAGKDYDDDENFLLSFSSDMKKMTHLQKIEFKLAMMKLLKDTFTENANSPPYHIDSSSREPPQLIYQEVKTSPRLRCRRISSIDQGHPKQRKHQK